MCQPELMHAARMLQSLRTQKRPSDGYIARCLQWMDFGKNLQYLNNCSSSLGRNAELLPPWHTTIISISDDKWATGAERRNCFKGLLCLHDETVFAFSSGEKLLLMKQWINQMPLTPNIVTIVSSFICFASRRAAQWRSRAARSASQMIHVNSLD